MRIFISYSRPNQHVVEGLAHDLEDLQHDVWFDRALTGGQDWWAHILSQIRDTELFVFAIAPETLDSVACQREFAYACDLHKRILPVTVADGVSMDLLPPRLGTIQFVDYRRQDKAAFVALTKALAKLPDSTPLPHPLPGPPATPVSKLGQLKEQIETASTLGLKDQAELVLTLKDMLHEPQQHADVLDLFQRLRKRDDLLANISREIDQIVATAEQARPVTPPAKGQQKGQPPEGMVLIPKGPFLYGKDRVHEEIPNDYYLDIYPVTNDHYKEFMLANGYGSQKYWSDEGWTWKKKDHVNRPKYWTDSKWNQADHPVVGVSYYEAEAYAIWAGKRLPTEQEWERAARGTDGRKYPWGNAFDKKKCNSEKSGIGATTPVTKYTKGISPSGCFDMAGNVWEWCESWYDQSRDLRVVRGESWGTSPENLRASLRSWLPTDIRGSTLGFRLAQGTP